MLVAAITVGVMAAACVNAPANHATVGSRADASALSAKPDEPEISAASNESEEAAAKSLTATPTEADADSCLRFAMPRSPESMASQLLINDAYASSFNRETLLPNWVAWRLTAEHTVGTVKRSGYQFVPDDRVPEGCQVTTFDYMRSGYDRGHMCPAGDNKWSEEAMEQCFLLTNICPQDHGLNVGDWNEMENQCRRWAKRYGEIYVVCGPILYRGKHKRIGHEHKVTVPEAFFKVVLCMKGKPWGVGFVYKNEDGDRPKGDYVNSIRQVERLTGLNFFPSLPDKVAQKVETQTVLPAD